MTDKVEAVNRIAETLKTGFGKKDKWPLRRHRDDDYCDRIEVNAGDVALLATIVPRYKTSHLSGDEWRVSARLQVAVGSTAADSRMVLERGFGRMRDLEKYASVFLWRECRALLGVRDATLTACRKGVVLTERKFDTFGEAALGMGWHIVTANEGERGVPWHHLSDEEERQHCQQVGCSEPPVNVYRLKKILYGDHPPETFMVPKYDFEGQYVCYCARHTTRGDCGFEDADANMVLVSGNGLAREHADDESPSIMGGVVEIDPSAREGSGKD
jgi:hypothetical protein